MVVADTEDISCEIFEIKHTRRIFPNQYRHLTIEGFPILSGGLSGRKQMKITGYGPEKWRKFYGT